MALKLFNLGDIIRLLEMRLKNENEFLWEGGKVSTKNSDVKDRTSKKLDDVAVYIPDESYVVQIMHETGNLRLFKDAFSDPRLGYLEIETGTAVMKNKKEFTADYEALRLHVYYGLEMIDIQSPVSTSRIEILRVSQPMFTRVMKYDIRVDRQNGHDADLRDIFPDELFYKATLTTLYVEAEKHVNGEPSKVSFI